MVAFLCNLYNSAIPLRFLETLHNYCTTRHENPFPMPNETHRLNEVIKYEFYHHRETGSSAEPTTARSPRGIEARNTHTHTNNRSTMDTKLNHTSSSTPGTKHRHRHRKPSWTGGSRAPSLLHSRVLAAPKLQPSCGGAVSAPVGQVANYLVIHCGDPA